MCTLLGLVISGGKRFIRGNGKISKYFLWGSDVILRTSDRAMNSGWLGICDSCAR